MAAVEARPRRAELEGLTYWDTVNNAPAKIAAIVVGAKGGFPVQIGKNTYDPREGINLSTVTVPSDEQESSEITQQGSNVYGPEDKRSYWSKLRWETSEMKVLEAMIYGGNFAVLAENLPKLQWSDERIRNITAVHLYSTASNIRADARRETTHPKGASYYLPQLDKDSIVKNADRRADRMERKARRMLGNLIPITQDIPEMYEIVWQAADKVFQSSQAA